MDGTNKLILSILQEDGTITNKNLAERIGLSPATTLERVRKLEAGGYIRGYVALLDGEKIGKGTTVFVSLTLLEHSVNALTTIEEAVVNMPEVLECHRMTGDIDYLLKVAVRDIKEYEDFATHRIASIPYIAKIWTQFSLTAVKSTTAFDLSDMVD